MLGTILVARFVRVTIGSIAQRQMPPTELPEQLRYRRAVVMATTRTIIGVLWFGAALLVIDRLRLPVATLVAPATVIGAALGFGAQKLVGDFLSGFFIIAERQIGYGDVVEISPPGTTQWMRGTVEEITLRYTRLRTPDGGVLTLSNSDVRQVLNRSRGWSKVDVTVPVAPDANLEQVVIDLRESLKALQNDEKWNEKLLGEPAVAGIERLDLERVDLRVSARTTPGAVDEVARELRRRAAVVTRDE